MALRSHSFSSNTLRARDGNSASLGKTHRHDLAQREFTYARPQVSREHSLATQSLFQPDDAILHRERENPGKKRQKNETRRQEDGHQPIQRKARHFPVVKRPQKIKGHYPEDVHVEQRDEFGVIVEILFGHADTYFLFL
jgi:hypothetical protein